MNRTDSAPPRNRPPPPQRMELSPDLLLDARRAAFLPGDSVLAVADLHLGYAWAQRTRGLLLPVETPDTTAQRLADLAADYSPRTVAILGDLVHRTVAHPGLETLLRDLCAALPGYDLVLCPGNHDRRIERLLSEWSLPIRLVPAFQCRRHRLHHGDDPVPEDPADGFRLIGGATVSISGHEHPAIELGDGVATRARVPCFLVSDPAVILPAFSDWAAGCVAGRDAFLGSTARGARFHTAFACLGPRLLRVPLGRNLRPALP